jgi:hypothetical protein
VTRNGGKVVTVPLAPRTARAIDLAIGERTDGRYSWLQTDGGWTGPRDCPPRRDRQDRHAAYVAARVHYRRP